MISLKRVCVSNDVSNDDSIAGYNSIIDHVAISRAYQHDSCAGELFMQTTGASRGKRVQQSNRVRASAEYKSYRTSGGSAHSPDPYEEMSKRQWEDCLRAFKAFLRRGLPIPPPPPTSDYQGITLSPIAPIFVPQSLQQLPTLQWLGGVTDAEIDGEIWLKTFLSTNDGASLTCTDAFELAVTDSHSRAEPVIFDDGDLGQPGQSSLKLFFDPVNSALAASSTEARWAASSFVAAQPRFASRNGSESGVTEQ